LKRDREEEKEHKKKIREIEEREEEQKEHKKKIREMEERERRNRRSTRDR
jgi:hypothetical protein